MPLYASTIPHNLQKKWSVIGHYDDKGVSAIVNNDFFISDVGRNNPTAEYQAFVNTIQNYIETGQGADILCRYPSRLTLVDKHTNLFSDTQKPGCQSYIDKVQPHKIQGASLLYASGFFDNPASYYGHSLIRFHYDDETFYDTPVIDASLNYGAELNGDTPGLRYIAKGLFGGYRASYKPNDAFLNTHNYTNGQLRDVWDFELNLTDEQIQFMAEHAWELQNAKFDYYFINDNCAHKIIDLIERATDTKIATTHGAWMMPIQITGQTIADDNALVKNISYRPSLETRFKKRYLNLPPQEATSFNGFLRGKVVVADISNKTLLLLLDYLDVQVVKLKKSDANYKDDLQFISKKRRKILNGLLSRPAQGQRQAIAYDKQASYRPISSIRTGYIHRNESNYGTISYRIANHDLLDRNNMRDGKSQFIMGDIGVELNKSKVDISTFTPLDIIQLKPNIMPVDIAWQPSWRLAVDYTARNGTCDNCKTAGVTNQIGTTHYIGADNVTAYGLIGGRVNHRHADDYDHLTWIADVGIISDFDELGRFIGRISAKASSDFANDEAIVGGEYAYDIDNTKDFRIKFESNLDGETTFSINIGYYFD